MPFINPTPAAEAKLLGEKVARIKTELALDESLPLAQAVRAAQAAVGAEPKGVLAEQVDALLRESEFFVLVSHIHWLSWSLIQARYSKIDFDYFEYFNQRMKIYFLQKDEFKVPV